VTAGPAFDHYLMVDWSARSRPATGADSLWIAHGRWTRTGGIACTTCNPATRSAGLAVIREILAGILAAPGRTQRVLVGWDFACGYPAGTADALGLPGGDPAWQRIWTWLHRAVHDDLDGRPNRHNRAAVAALANARIAPTDRPGPFWGEANGPLLTRTRVGTIAYPYGAAMINQRRLTDQRCQGQSVWQLLGHGAVGGQTLLGIPRLEALRQDFAARLAMWPFTSGWRLPTTPIVLAEVYPALVPHSGHPGTTKDERQVRALVDWYARADRAGDLPAHFSRPTGLSDSASHAALAEEGWILGGR
jgi:hypothetical protein